MKDSNSPDIIPCDICGQPVDRRILCEVWKHQHYKDHVEIPADIVGEKAEHFADIMKISKALRESGESLFSKKGITSNITYTSYGS